MFYVELVSECTGFQIKCYFLTGLFWELSSTPQNAPFHINSLQSEFLTVFKIIRCSTSQNLVVCQNFLSMDLPCVQLRTIFTFLWPGIYFLFLLCAFLFPCQSHFLILNLLEEMGLVGVAIGVDSGNQFTISFLKYFLKNYDLISVELVQRVD